MSLRDRILAAEDRPFLDVEVPEWGLTVRVASMSGLDRDLWETDMLSRRALDSRARMGNLRASLVARCLVDPETGERVFREEDIELLGKKAAKALDRLFAAASDLNGLSDKDVAELEKK